MGETSVKGDVGNDLPCWTSWRCGVGTVDSFSSPASPVIL